MVRPAAFAAAFVWVFCVAASAQTPNPILQHYRAYQAAFAADDFATAEREAAAALAASEARDGDGGRTAVLALNLASVRLLTGDPEGALAPGRRALQLAQSAGQEATGVAPAHALLLVSRAELLAGRAGAEDQLSAALEVAQQQQLDAAEIHNAAVELAASTFRNSRYGESRHAWSVAAASAEGSAFGEQFARANALTGEGASLILEDLHDRRRGAELDDDVAREAYDLLIQAIGALRPLAEMNAEGEITHAQRSYANALAWRAVLRAKLLSDGQDIPETREAQGDADGLSEVDIGPASAGQPRCFLRFSPRGDSSRMYPDRAIDQGHLAGVAVRFRVNDAGRVEDADAIAIIGHDDFRDAVEDPSDWRVERREDSPPNCRMAMSVIQSISFAIR